MRDTERKNEKVTRKKKSSTGKKKKPDARG